jgi:hypothetical protein
MFNKLFRNCHQSCFTFMLQQYNLNSWYRDVEWSTNVLLVWIISCVCFLSSFPFPFLFMYVSSFDLPLFVHLLCDVSFSVSFVLPPCRIYVDCIPDLDWGYQRKAKCMNALWKWILIFNHTVFTYKA